jgi:hypothetical protein
MPQDKKDDDTIKESNGEKNGDLKENEVEDAGSKKVVSSDEKLSLGEIAAIDAEIAKAKIEQLQLLHNVSIISL